MTESPATTQARDNLKRHLQGLANQQTDRLVGGVMAEVEKLMDGKIRDLLTNLKEQGLLKA